MSIQDDIVPGKIFYLNVCFPHQERPEKKYLVLVGIDHKNRALFLKINTRIPYSENGRGYTEPGFRLKINQYQFLDHESFLRCGNVWDNLLTYDELLAQLLSGDGVAVGDLILDHCKEVVNKTQSSKAISNKNKQIIQDAMKNIS